MSLILDRKLLGNINT